MGDYTKVNLRRDVENQAPKFDMPDELQARFARTPLEGETLGLSLMKLDAGVPDPFGHKHPGQEEVYVVVRGSGRVKVEDEIVDLAEWDAIRIGKDTMRNIESGPDGIEFLAFGAGDDPRDAEMEPGWWTTKPRLDDVGRCGHPHHETPARRTAGCLATGSLRCVNRRSSEQEAPDDDDHPHDGLTSPIPSRSRSSGCSRPATTSAGSTRRSPTRPGSAPAGRRACAPTSRRRRRSRTQASG